MKKIKEFRKANFLTQKQLAHTLGVKQSSVSQWETGQNCPTVDILIKLSALFHCTIDELVRGEDDGSPAEAKKNDRSGL